MATFAFSDILRRIEALQQELRPKVLGYEVPVHFRAVEQVPMPSDLPVDQSVLRLRNHAHHFGQLRVSRYAGELR